MAASNAPPSGPSCTGATYTIIATTSGYGSLSNIDTLPRQLTAMHLSLFPHTPRHDVQAFHSGYKNEEVFTGSTESRLLKVVVEVRKGAWSPQNKRILLERVHGQLMQWKGKKAEKTDIIVQMTEIEDWICVLRNGRWGMWEGAVPADIDGKDETKSVADSERTLVS